MNDINHIMNNGIQTKFSNISCWLFNFVSILAQCKLENDIWVWTGKYEPELHLIKFDYITKCVESPKFIFKNRNLCICSKNTTIPYVPLHTALMELIEIEFGDKIENIDNTKFLEFTSSVKSSHLYDAFCYFYEKIGEMKLWENIYDEETFDR